MASGVDARARRGRAALVALSRERLSRAPGSRVGAFGAAGVTLVALVGAALLVSSSVDADLNDYVAKAVRWILWLGVGPLALSIANRRSAADRVDGVEVLTRLRGYRAEPIERARWLAAMGQVSLRVALPSVVLCVLVAAFAWRDSLALMAQAFVLCLFALVCGVAVGAVAALCGRLGGRRGRSVLLAVVLVPWAVFGQVGRAEWSLPGALDLLLEVMSLSSWTTGALL